MSSARSGDKSKDEWQTPKWLFNLLDREFGFTLDAAATKENALCENYFTDHSVDPYSRGDGLISSWSGRVFVNPPYSTAALWMKKAKEELAADNVDVVAMLLPARTDTKAWWKFARFEGVRLLPGRLKFGISPEKRQEIIEENIKRQIAGKKLLPEDGFTAPFPSAVVIFEPITYYKIGESRTWYWDVHDPERGKRKKK